MQLFLHIGLPKTGSTTFQQLIWPNWPGITYLGRGVDLQKAVSADTPKVLFSSEGLSCGLKRLHMDRHRRHQDEFEQRLRNLSGIVPNAKVILGLRKPVPMLASVYKSYVKYGGTLSLANYFCGAEPFVTADDLRTLKKIEFVATLFPGRAFFFFVEEIEHNFDGLISDLADFFDTDVPNINLPESNSLNNGLGKRQLFVARAVNKLTWEQLGTRLSLSPTGTFRTAGFRVATTLNRIGLLHKDRPIKIPEKMQDAIRRETRHDLRDSVALILTFRSNLRLSV